MVNESKILENEEAMSEDKPETSDEEASDNEDEEASDNEADESAEDEEGDEPAENGSEPIEGEADVAEKVELPPRKRINVKILDRIYKDRLQWETSHFTWEEDFMNWKAQIEKDTGVTFRAGERNTNKDGYYQYFSCDHSNSDEAANGEDSDSGHDSDTAKPDSVLPCPAELILLFNPDLDIEKHFTAQYQSIHIGHDTKNGVPVKDVPQKSVVKQQEQQSEFAKQYQPILAGLKGLIAERDLTADELNQLKQTLAKIKAQRNAKVQKVEVDVEEEEEEDESEEIIPSKKAKKMKSPGKNGKRQSSSWSMELL